MSVQNPTSTYKRPFRQTVSTGFIGHFAHGLRRGYQPRRIQHTSRLAASLIASAFAVFTPNMPALAQGTPAPAIVVTPDIFHAPPIAVPEFQIRQDSMEWAFSTHSSVVFQHMKKAVAAMRDKREKSPSGLWNLTFFYAALEDATAQVYWDPKEQEEFEKVYQTVVHGDPLDPLIYVVKGHVLMANLRAALDRRLTLYMPPIQQEALKRERFDAVQSYLESVKANAANDPGWYRVKLRSTMWSCLETNKLWTVLEEGSRKFPDYYQLYFDAMTVAFQCLPAHEIWPARERIIELARNRAAPGDEDVAYARSMWFVAQSINSDHIFFNGRVDWDRMRKGIETILDRYPEPWNLNNLSKFACAALDKGLALRLLPKVVSQPIPAVWQPSILFEQCWQWSHHPTSPDRGSLKRAQAPTP